MCVYKTDDGKCKKFSDGKITSYCVESPCEYEKLSNYDRIRNMSVEELTEFILENKIVAMENAVAQMGLAFECSQSSIERCRKEIKQTLESEVTE